MTTFSAPDASSAKQLLSFIERIENLEEEKKAIAREYKELLRISYQTLTDSDKKLIRKAFDVAVEAHKAAVYDEAAGTGLDKKVIRKLISWRKKTEEERSEEDQLFQIYLEAIESLCNAAPANNVVKIA